MTFHFCYFFLKKWYLLHSPGWLGTFYAVVASLELTMTARPAFSLQQSSCLCPTDAEIIGRCHYVQHQIMEKLNRIHARFALRKHYKQKWLCTDALLGESLVTEGTRLQAAWLLPDCMWCWLSFPWKRSPYRKKNSLPEACSVPGTRLYVPSTLSQLPLQQFFHLMTLTPFDRIRTLRVFRVS